VAPSASEDITLDQTLQAIVKHAKWLADRLPVGGVVPVAGDIGIMVLEKADLEAGTPAKLCEVHQTSAGWTRIN